MEPVTTPSVLDSIRLDLDDCEKQYEESISKSCELRVDSFLASGNYATFPALSPPPGMTSLYDHGMEHRLPSQLLLSRLPRPLLDCKPVSFDVEHLKVPAILDHLSLLHGHERDQHLKFEDAGHRYFWKNESVDMSVTGLLRLFTAAFKEKDVIDSMRQGNNWPRAAYVKPYASLQLLQTSKPYLARRNSSAYCSSYHAIEMQWPSLFAPWCVPMQHTKSWRTWSA